MKTTKILARSDTMRSSMATIIYTGRADLSQLADTAVAVMLWLPRSHPTQAQRYKADTWQRGESMGPDEGTWHPQPQRPFSGVDMVWDGTDGTWHGHSGWERGMGEAVLSHPAAARI